MKLNLIILSILTSTILFSQDNIWSEYYSDNFVKIDYKYELCDFSSTASQELIVFKYTNLTNQDLILSFNYKIWKIQNIKETALENNRIYIKIKADEIKIDNCYSNEFNIFSSFVHNETFEKFNYLKKFELTNIKINYE
tara:strand:+ start:13 stop:429 length:417 start_codon:yes stop_codon:yes gene_type:complete